MKAAVTLVLLAMLGASAHAAETYRWIDGDTVVYSDVPPRESAETADAAEARRVAPSPPASVEEILTLAGLRDGLADFARSLGAEYVPRRGQLDERDAARVAQQVARHFTAEPMYAAIRDDFRRHADATQLAAMATWFRSPLARHITALENAAAQADAMSQITAFAAGLKTSPPTPSRLELVQRLDWLTGATEISTDFALTITASLARASAAAAPADQRTRPGLVERGVEELRAQTRAALADSVVAHMLYVYAPLSDADLKAYMDFLASPAGRVYNRLAREALRRSVREVADQTATAILHAVPRERWTTAQENAPTAEH